MWNAKIFSATTLGTSKCNATSFLLSGALPEVGETMAHIWPQVVEIVALQEFYKTDRFLTAPLCHIYDSHSYKFSYFDLKSHRKNEFYKKTSSINENILNA